VLEAGEEATPEAKPNRKIITSQAIAVEVTTNGE